MANLFEKSKATATVKKVEKHEVVEISKKYEKDLSRMAAIDIAIAELEAEKATLDSGVREEAKSSMIKLYDSKKSFPGTIKVKAGNQSFLFITADKYIKIDEARAKELSEMYGEETVTIDIPAGVQEGMQLSISGKGNAGERGGSSGDLIVLIEEEAHPQLHRDGLNVAFDLYISFPEAVFGTQVEVPTIDGRAKIKIPVGTQSGKIFRLKGKGFPHVNSYEKGDQLIQVNIWTPQHVSSEEKEMLEKMQESTNFEPKPEKNEKSFFDKVREMFS